MARLGRGYAASVLVRRNAAAQPTTGTVAQTLPTPTQALDADAAVESAIAQTLPVLGQAVDAVATITADIAQTLPAVTQAVLGGGTVGDIAQTLPAVTQSVLAGDSVAEVAQTLPAPTQALVVESDAQAPARPSGGGRFAPLTYVTQNVLRASGRAGFVISAVGRVLSDFGRRSFGLRAAGRATQIRATARTTIVVDTRTAQTQRTPPARSGFASQAEGEALYQTYEPKRHLLDTPQGREQHEREALALLGLGDLT